MRVGLAASEEVEKGKKATNHTHILVTKTPLLPPAASRSSFQIQILLPPDLCERSDTHTTVAAAVVSAHNFS